VEQGIGVDLTVQGFAERNEVFDFSVALSDHHNISRGSRIRRLVARRQTIAKLYPTNSQSPAQGNRNASFISFLLFRYIVPYLKYYIPSSENELEMWSCLCCSFE
jgi:hypothetical protein